MSLRNHPRPVRGAAVLVLVGGMLIPGVAGAVVNPNNFTWIGATSGGQIWNDGSNWSYSDSTLPVDGGPLTGTGLVPGLFGQIYPGESASIGETTGDRTITTPSVVTNVYGVFSVVQTPTSVGVNTLKLGGDLYQYGVPWSSYVNNTTASAANMVIDLNGHKMGGYIAQYDRVTFVTSAPGGELNDAYGPGIYNSIISAGVTVAPAGWMFSGGNTNTWMPGSRLLLRGGVQMYTYGDQQAYRLEIGESASPAQGAMQLVNNWAQSVATDVVIYAPTNANPLDLGASALSVGGNFTDYGTVAGASYANGTLVFNRNPVTPGTITIDRLLDATVNVRVGNSSADKGNVALGHNLNMAGNFAVTNGSALDLGDPILTAGSFTQLADPLGTATSIEIGIDLTGAPGSVQVNGDLTLNDFTLHIYGHTDLTQNLVIFNYTGNLIGSPNLVGVTVDTSTGLLYYDSFEVSGGQVKLTNVFIPEPASLGLLAAGGVLLLRRRAR